MTQVESWRDLKHAGDDSVRSVPEAADIVVSAAATLPPSTLPPSTDLLGHRIDRLRLEETAEHCCDAVRQRRRIHHVSLNAAKIVRARTDERLARAIDNAEVVSPDGQSVVWASRLFGLPLPERVPGIDLMLRLLEIAEASGFAVFFLGAKRDILASAVDEIRSRHPRLAIVGAHHGYFDEADSPAICQTINASGAEILFVAMSSPRKEYWVSDHRETLTVPLIVGVGGALDVVAGQVARAPRWMQRTGLEWSFRLAQEPRRLWRRYLVTNSKFVAILVAELARQKLKALGWPRSVESRTTVDAANAPDQTGTGYRGDRS